MTKIALKAMAVTLAIAFAMPAAACMDPFTWPTPDDLSGNACGIGDPYAIDEEAATGWKEGESGQFQFAAGSAWPRRDWPQPSGPSLVDFGAGVTMVEVDTVPKPVGSPFADGRTMVPFATGWTMETAKESVWPQPAAPDGTAFRVDGTIVNPDPAWSADSPFARGRAMAKAKAADPNWIESGIDGTAATICPPIIPGCDPRCPPVDAHARTTGEATTDAVAWPTRMTSARCRS